MKVKSLLLLLLLLINSLGGVKAMTYTTVVVGDAVASEEAISPDAYYVIYNAGNNSYLTIMGSNGNQLDYANSSATPASVFKLTKQSDGKYIIKAYGSDLYLGKFTHNQHPTFVTDQSEAGKVSFNFTASGKIHPKSESATDGGADLFWDRSSNKVIAWNTGKPDENSAQFFQIKQVTIQETTYDYPQEGFVYDVIQSRGRLCFQPSNSSYWVWANNAAADNDNRKWVFLSAEAETGAAHSYYMYNVGRKRFIEPVSAGTYFDQNSSGKTWAFTANKVPVTFTDRGDGTFSIATTTGDVHMSVSLNYAGPVISYYAANDGGVPISLEKGAAVTDEITAAIAAATDPIIATDLSVLQGYQTTGRGEERALIHRLDLFGYGVNAITPKSLHVSLTAEAAANVSKLQLYTASTVEMHKPGGDTRLLGEVEVAAGQTEYVVPFGDEVALATGVNYFFLTANVKADAAFSAVVDGAVTQLDYSKAGESEVLSMALSESVGNPTAQGLKVYGAHSFAWVPTEDNCRYYRIPAMVVDKNGNLVAVADRRYNNAGDLGGNHKIDLVSKRSEDGGLTWKDTNIFAVGEGNAERCGFGDAALALAPNGDIVCLMAAGNTTFAVNAPNPGMKHCFKSISKDNGVTWSTPEDIFTSEKFTDLKHNLTGELGFSSYFTTSGKGLTTKDGVIMYAAVTRGDTEGSTNYCYIIKSADNGESWSIGPNCAYAGSDESKLVQLNSDSIMVSVRQASAYPRGFNVADKDAIHWGTQYRNAGIPGGGGGGGCNADIIYYSRATEGARDIMLHTYHKSGARENLWLSMSLDEGKTWNDVMQLQPGNVLYSTMDRLPNGDLAIMIEDESYVSGNGWAMTYFTIPAEEIEKLAANLTEKLKLDAEVRIADLKTEGPDNRGAYTNNSQTYTSGANSGVTGVVLQAETVYTEAKKATFDKGNYAAPDVEGNVRCLVYWPSAANAVDRISVSAPAGYVLTGYTISAYANSDGTYTLTTANGVTGNAGVGAANMVTISETGLDTKSTYLDITCPATIGGSRYLVMPVCILTVKRVPECETVRVASAGYATHYSPRTLLVPDGVESVFTVKVSDDGKMLEASRVYDAGEVVPARTGFVVKAAAGNYPFEIVNEATPLDEGNILLGSTYDMTTVAPAGVANPVFYKLTQPAGQAVGFYYGAADGAAFTNKAYKAYLTLSGDAAVQGLAFADAITGITDAATAPAAPAAVYDLSGRRVARPAKGGIYIVGGRKVIF